MKKAIAATSLQVAESRAAATLHGASSELAVAVTRAAGAAADSGGSSSSSALEVKTPGSPTPEEEPAAAQPPEGWRRWQLRIWLFMDDPSSGVWARRTSFFIMFVIALSVLSFTLESVPWDCRWVDRYETVVVDGESVEQRSFNPTRLCSELTEGRSPYFEIEFFCIMVFSIEFVVRLATCPAGPGLGAFWTTLMNWIDLVAIVPWYINVITGGGAALSGLAVLRVLRLARVMRIFKMSKNFQGLILLMQTFKRSASALAMLIFFVGMSLIVFATLIFQVRTNTAVKRGVNRSVATLIFHAGPHAEKRRGNPCHARHAIQI